MQTIFKILGSAVIAIIALIPAEIWFGIYKLVEPDGFWQKLVIVGIGFWVLGLLQLAFFIVGCSAMMAYWEID